MPTAPPVRATVPTPADGETVPRLPDLPEDMRDGGSVVEGAPTVSPTAADDVILSRPATANPGPAAGANVREGDGVRVLRLPATPVAETEGNAVTEN